MLGSRGAGCANPCSAVDRNYLGKLEHAKEEATCLRRIAPPAGSVKINVNAAVRKHQNVGPITVVCRAEDGHYLGASAVVIQGISD
jgi:hypothetical protein